MGYSVDSGSDNVVHGSKSLDLTDTASAGSHILRVKAWGTSGAYCETDVSLTVSSTGGLVPGAGANHAYNLENYTTYTGAYTDPAGNGTTCPDNGAASSDTYLWLTESDCGTGGTKSGSTTNQITTPTYGGESNSREFTMTYSQPGLSYRAGVRWSNKAITNDSSSMHFQYDTYVYFPTATDVGNLGNLELDINHVVNSKLYILGVQCNLTEGLWQVTVEGAPGTWVDTNAACTNTPTTAIPYPLVTPGVWHHFQIQTHQNAGTIYYDAVAIDGNVTPITSCTNASTRASIVCQSTPSNPGWGSLIGPNFQIDGSGAGGSATAYVDDFTVYYW